MARARQCGGAAFTAADKCVCPIFRAMSAEQDRRRAGAYAWWQRGIIYQVYPRSFQDSNGDGVGDLRGITQRLDYLRWLGIDAVWVSPIYPSPMKDFGYDVADYCNVHPQFGTLQDFDELVRRSAWARAQSHSRLRAQSHVGPASVVCREPLLAIEPEARLVHLARSGADGGPPNNWLSNFGGSGWQFDEHTRPVLLPCVPRRAAGSELAQSRSRAGDARCPALLARSRRRWFSRGRDLASHQGRGVPRQSAQSHVDARRQSRTTSSCRSTRATGPKCTT